MKIGVFMMIMMERIMRMQKAMEQMMKMMI